MSSRLKLQNNSHDKRILINVRNATGIKNTYSKYCKRKDNNFRKIILFKAEK